MSRELQDRFEDDIHALAREATRLLHGRGGRFFILILDEQNGEMPSVSNIPDDEHVIGEWVKSMTVIESMHDGTTSARKTGQEKN